MNNQIINNVYEFWKHIGRLTNKLIETEYYSTVSMDNSDWPNRVFDLKNNNDIIEKVLKLSKEGKIPELVTIANPNDLKNNCDVEFVFRQKNMAFDLKSIPKNISANSNIKRVEIKKDSINFAEVASKSFGYKVDHKVVFKIVNDSEIVRLFVFEENSEYLGCGIVFFDSYNNAGLHMIGTLPKARGYGIGKRMTEKLLIEAKINNMNFCVLHASLMGEPIYRKLEFEPYGAIETYKILKKGNNKKS